MKGSHVFNLHQSAIIKGTYCFDNVEKSTVETIAAARIWRNIGRKAAQGYAAKHGLNMPRTINKIVLSVFRASSALIHLWIR